MTDREVQRGWRQISVADALPHLVGCSGAIIMTIPLGIWILATIAGSDRYVLSPGLAVASPMLGGMLVMLGLILLWRAGQRNVLPSTTIDRSMRRHSLPPFGEGTD